MNTPAPIQIFKPGKHTAMSGAVLEFSESDLQAASEAYSPTLHEAPIVIGHPKLDAPAYGWVRSLQFADGGLSAEPDQVDPEFAELVKAGRFKKVSASFFSPDSPRNPVPGVYYLRHVGFLGATPPAVKGLKQVEFAADDEGVIEFSAGDWQTSSIFRRLRDWMIDQFGQDTADEVIPSWEIDSIREMAVREEAREIISPHFSEPTSKGDEMSAEEKARMVALEAENKRLKQEQADFAEAENKRRADAAHAAHESFAEGLIKEGRLLPANKALTVATLDMLAQRDEPYEFGEGDDKVAVSLDGYKAMLTAMPKAIEFSELSGAGGGDAGSVNFATPQGYSTDPAALEIHSKAMAHQAANPNTSYLDAVKTVSK